METVGKDNPKKFWLDLNTPRISEPSFQAPPINDYGVMQCTNIVTSEFLAYLATAYDQYGILSQT
jgi:hypothetical protein